MVTTRRQSGSEYHQLDSEWEARTVNCYTRSPLDEGYDLIVLKLSMACLLNITSDLISEYIHKINRIYLYIQYSIPALTSIY
jgi:hypothetical protein